MAKSDSTLNQYLSRTNPEAAQAGRAAIEYLMSLEGVSWKTNNATIDFRAKRQFCSLWPVKSHITFWITKTAEVEDPKSRLKGDGKTANLKLYSEADFDEYLKKLLKESYRSEGLRPLSR